MLFKNVFKAPISGKGLFSAICSRTWTSSGRRILLHQVHPRHPTLVPGHSENQVATWIIFTRPLTTIETVRHIYQYNTHLNYVLIIHSYMEYLYTVYIYIQFLYIHVYHCIYVNNCKYRVISLYVHMWKQYIQYRSKSCINNQSDLWLNMHA